MVIGFILYIILLLFVLFLLFYLFIFLRDPERDIPSGNNITAPADGKVISIIKVGKGNVELKKGLIGRVKILSSDVVNEGYLISIFMSLFNVHVNRAPINGKVISVKHKSGKFFMAFDVEKSFLNESNEIVMMTKLGKIKIIQIAGFLARRIKCFIKEKQNVNKGERIGMISLGSQVSLILPDKIRLRVKIGDRVKAGETIIGEY